MSLGLARDRTAGAGGPGLSVDDVLRLLGTDAVRGLAHGDAAGRLRRCGPNALPPPRRAGPVRRFARQLSSPLVLLLLAAAVATLALGERVETVVILGVVGMNAVVGFLQESRAEAALASLRRMTRTSARVVRGGRRVVVSSEALVPGDLVLLEAGDRVPADLRVVSAARLVVDESAFTGESVPVAKDPAAVPPGTELAERLDAAWSGTLVTAGSGAGVVVATGGATELGAVSRLVAEVDVLATPLTRQLATAGRVLTVAVLVLAAATVALGTARGEPVADMVVAAVALAVGAIPEGLPAAVTITLALGVARMARRGAVVRQLPAVETLGSTTVVCTDKTGTLTENRMTVQRVWTPAAGVREGHGAAWTRDDAAADAGLRWALAAGALCSGARLVPGSDPPEAIGEPTEAALVVAAARLDVPGLAARLPRLAEVPFSSQRGWMATLHADAADGPDGPAGPAGGDARVLLVKGAPERLVPAAVGVVAADGSVGPLDGPAVERLAERLADDGLRVLATGVRFGDRDLDGLVAGLGDQPPAGLLLTGLVGLMDPPRPAAGPAVQACREAGIRVVVVTGDHPRTAAAVARRLGLLPERPGGLLTGREIAGLAPDALGAALEEATVLARVTPEQKLRLVEALQARGHVVAMTGDGVNDAPALRQADVGVAMGRDGTEVAKDAADVVLTDDDFATVAAAVEEGRGIFDNLVKFLAWTLPTNAGEGLVVLVAVVLGTALPITPVQILWINMTTAVALGLTLAVEPREPDVMRRPPRDPARPLISREVVLRTALVAGLLVAAATWAFSAELGAGSTAAEARTVAVNLFVAVEIAYLVGCRSLRGPVRLRRPAGAPGNPWLVLGVAVQVVGQLALTYLPAMNGVFGTAPLDAGQWARVLAVGLLALGVVLAEGRVRGALAARRRAPPRPGLPGGAAPRP